MKKYLFVILAFLAIGCAGCADNAYKIIAPAQPDSYLPETYGTTWRYRDSTYIERDSSGAYTTKIDTIRLTIDGNTTDINGAICYNAITSSTQNGTGTAYLNAQKHVFSLFQSTAPFGLTNFGLLVDTGAVGYTWGSCPSLNTLINGQLVRSINTIVKKNMTKIVGGITFTQVIHTTANFQMYIKGIGFRNIAFYDIYLAKNIGLIEKDTYVYGTLNATQTIIDYVIK